MSNESTLDYNRENNPIPPTSIGGNANGHDPRSSFCTTLKTGVFVPGFSGKEYERVFTILCAKKGIRILPKPDIRKKTRKTESKMESFHYSTNPNVEGSSAASGDPDA